MDEERFWSTIGRHVKPTELTYFGRWSAMKMREVTALLDGLGARYEVQVTTAEKDVLENWSSWDATAADPYVAYDLWILNEDLDKVWFKIVEQFPERKGGAT